MDVAQTPPMNDPQKSGSPRNKALWIVLAVSLVVIVVAAVVTTLIVTSSGGGASASSDGGAPWRISSHLPMKFTGLARDPNARADTTNARVQDFGTPSSFDTAVYNTNTPTDHQYGISVWNGTFEPPEQAYNTLDTHYPVPGGWKQMAPGPHGGMLACGTATVAGRPAVTCFFETSTTFGAVTGFTTAGSGIDPKTVAHLATEVRSAIETQG